MSKFRLLKDFFGFVKQSKKIWLVPIFIVLGFISLLILVSQSQAMATAIYTLF